MCLNRNRIFFLWGRVECGGVLLGLLLFLSGCVREEYSEETSAGMGVLRFSLATASSHNVSTRVIDESTINDLYLLVYDASHQLLKKEYYSSPLASPSDLTLSVRSGSGYTVYGIANTGNASLFSDVSAINTEEELKAFTVTLSSWDEIGSESYMLMSGSVTDVTVLASSSNSSSPVSTCSLSLKRLAAKVTLNVGIAAGSGVTISGYRIYGIPKKSFYIAHPLSTEENSDGVDTQTTRAQDASLPVNEGDWMDSGALTPTSGTSINATFYMYENRPGVNTAITLQKNKIKANVPASPVDSAAYVEVYGMAPGYVLLSWKIYLGANNTTNFNIKRNCTYTCTATLKPNDSDVRINYNKLIWAGSNIYWDGTKLTFDPAPVDPANPTAQELSNMKKQGVCFQWGSLIGISLSSSYVTYTPAYNSGNPTVSSWNMGSTSYSSIAYISVEGSDYGVTNTFLNDAAQNTDANYVAFKGDICKYLSKTQPSLGSWRMPTEKEFDSTNFGNATPDNPGPWAWWGTSVSQSTNPDGQSNMNFGVIHTVSSVTTYSASGFHNANGTLSDVGQYGIYWSSSASSSTYGFSLHFYSSFVYPGIGNDRQYGLAVRCVQN